MSVFSSQNFREKNLRRSKISADMRCFILKPRTAPYNTFHRLKCLRAEAETRLCPSIIQRMFVTLRKTRIGLERRRLRPQTDLSRSGGKDKMDTCRCPTAKAGDKERTARDIQPRQRGAETSVWRRVLLLDVNSATQ